MLMSYDMFFARYNFFLEQKFAGDLNCSSSVIDFLLTWVYSKLPLELLFKKVVEGPIPAGKVWLKFDFKTLPKLWLKSLTVILLLLIPKTD